MERWGEQHNNWTKLPKAREKLVAKMENRKMSWEARQRIDRQLSKLLFEAIVNAYMSALILAYIKGNLVLNILFDKFRIDGDRLCSKSGRQRGAPPVPVAFIVAFLFLTEWYSFPLLWAWFFLCLLVFCFLLFVFFKYRTFFRYWFLHEQRIFHKQRKNEPQDERCRENRLSGLTLVWDY